jgi:hypothetical protein
MRTLTIIRRLTHRGVDGGHRSRRSFRLCWSDVEHTTGVSEQLLTPEFFNIL